MIDPNLQNKIAQGRAKALQMGYRPEQVDNYIKQKFGDVAPPRPTGFGGMIKNIANTALGLPKLALGGVYELPRFLKAQKGDYSGYIDQKTGATKQNPFLTDREMGKYNVEQNGLGGASMDALKRGVGTFAAMAPMAAAPIAGAGLLASRLAVGASKPALGALSGGALAGAGQEFAQEDSTLGSTLTAGAIGGATGYGLSKIPSLIQRMRGLNKGVGEITPEAASTVAGDATKAVKPAGMQTLTNDVVGELSSQEKQFMQQFEIPRKIAEREQPWRSVKILTGKYGIAPDDLGKLKTLSGTVTGADGILSKSVRNAAGSVKGEIDTAGAFEAVKRAIDNAIDLSPDDEKKLLAMIGKSVKSGKVPLKSNPLDVLDTIKTLEKRGYEFSSKSTSLSPNNRYEELGSALLDAADELKTNLYKTIQDQGVISKIKDVNTYNALAKISPELAKDYWGTTTAEGLRSLQKPFVDLGKMVDYTLSAQNTAFTKASERAGGNIVTRTLSPVLEPASDVTQGVLKKVMRPVSRFVASAADKVKGIKDIKISPQVKTLISRAASGIPIEKIPQGAIAPASIAGGMAASSYRGTPSDQGGIPAQQLTNTGQQPASTGVQSVNIGGIEVTPEKIQRAIMLDFQSTGGRNYATLSKMLDVYERVQKMQGGGVKKMGSVQEQNYNKAVTAYRALDSLESKLSTDSWSVVKSATPLNPGAREYRSYWGSIIDVIGSLRTGASYTTAQRKDYEHLLPVLGDSKTTIDNKLKKLREELSLYIEPKNQVSEGMTADQLTQLAQ